MKAGRAMLCHGVSGLLLCGDTAASVLFPVPGALLMPFRLQTYDGCAKSTLMLHKDLQFLDCHHSTASVCLQPSCLSKNRHFMWLVKSKALFLALFNIFSDPKKARFSV